MFGLGTPELVVILVILFLVFGASRLPELGKGLGQGMRGFRDSLRGKDEADAVTEKDETEKKVGQG